MTVEVICDNCGDVYETTKYKRDRTDSNYCSQSCYGESIGEGKVECECEYCGATFDRYKSDIKGKTFCDKECHYNWQKEHGSKGPDHHNYDGGMVTATCHICGTEFQRHPSRMGRGEYTYCSPECAGKGNSGIEQKVNGRRIVSSHYWQKVRKKVLERDRRRCQICGGDSELHVHHLEPVSKGGEPFDMDNLITLCKSCHYHVAHEGGTTDSQIKSLVSL